VAHSKTSATVCASVPKRVRALELRIAGKRFTEIGKALGVGEARAYTFVKEELDRLNRQRTETASQLQRLECDRLDKMMAAVWPQAEAGDVNAIAAAVKLMQRRARLLGLDAPARSEEERTLNIKVTVEDVVASRGKAQNLRGQLLAPAPAPPPSTSGNGHANDNGHP
jgi:hypothetical protein